MKHLLVVICFFTILMTSSSVLSENELQKDVGNSSINQKMNVVILANRNNKRKVDIDGISAASKLRAKKSHSVSKQDEMGLTIFFGLIVLSVIAFFLKPFSERK